MSVLSLLTTYYRLPNIPTENYSTDPALSFPDYKMFSAFRIKTKLVNRSFGSSFNKEVARSASGSVNFFSA